MRSVIPSLGAVILSLAASAQAQTEEIQAKPVQAEQASTETGQTRVLATNEGWNSPFSLLFSFNNILAATTFLNSPISGTVGGSYYLGPSLAIRGGFNASRTHNAVQVSKTVNTTGGTEVTTYTVAPPGYTQQYALSLRGDLLKRLMRAEVAPYVGAGVSIGWTYNTLDYTDDKSVVDQRTEVDNNTSSFDLTARGIVGAEWRIHQNFAFFAEYNLAVAIATKNRTRTRTTVETTVGGSTATAEVTSERDYTTWFNVSTSLAQGASLGLSVFF